VEVQSAIRGARLEVGVAEETLLADDFLRQLINVGDVDIVVGLSTYNHAKTVAPVISAIQTGILKCFPRERVAIVNADGGSQDGTPELVTGASIDDVWRASKVYTLRTLHAISTRYGVTPDPSLALRTILAATDLLQAKACVLISPDSTTIEPDWLQRLARPVYYDNFDLVCPVYNRQRVEGALIRNLLYPMTRAIYGYRIREPYGSEFAISGRLATDFATNGLNTQDWARMGPEISLSIMAMAGRYRVCQSFLGTKVQPALGAADLVDVMRRTVGVLFSSLDSNFSAWSGVAGSEAVPMIGNPISAAQEAIQVNRERLREMFINGVGELQPVFRSILSASTLSDLQRVASSNGNEFSYPGELWTRTVFEFANAHHKSVINRDHIIQALIPLYRGRALSFLLENENGSAENIERSVESLCGEFEKLKPYLLQIWSNGK
jgi:glucosylglycerate synthase